MSATVKPGEAASTARCSMSGVIPRDGFLRVGAEGLGNPRSQIAQCMGYFRERLYVGVTHPKGAGPDDAARIMCYEPEADEWREVHRSPLVGADDKASVRDIYRQGHDRAPRRDKKVSMDRVPRDRGYRCMTRYSRADGTEVLLASTLSHWGSMLLYSVDGERFETCSPPGLGDSDVLSFRNVLPYRGKLFVAPAGSVKEGVMDRNFGDVARLFVSDDPFSNQWSEAMPSGFGDPGNRAIFSLATFNEFLYAGTGNPMRGFQIWKTSAEGEAPYRWTRVLHDGAFRYGLNETAATMTVFGDALYVSSGVPGLGYDKANDIGPAAAELLRVNADDSWDLVAGTPRFTPDGLKVPLSLKGPGLDDAENSVIWSMAAHDGVLYAGTHHNRVWKTALAGEPEVQGGFQLWAAEDGERFEPITLDGFGDPYAAGARTLLSTPVGLFLGTATHREVERIWLVRSGQRVRPGVGGLAVWWGDLKS